MVRDDFERTIRSIQVSGRQLVVIATGCDRHLMDALLEVADIPAIILVEVVPSDIRALEQRLGGNVDTPASEATARAMAMTAFERGRNLVGVDPLVLVGVGLAAIPTIDLPEQGPRRLHVAWQLADRTAVQVYDCANHDEGHQLATQLVLTVLADACDVESKFDDVSATIPNTRHEVIAPRQWHDLLLGNRPSVLVGDPREVPDEPLLFPGAFNPLHDGHRRMAKVAELRLGVPVTWELSIQNVDKRPLDYIELQKRVAQFADRPLLLTRTPTFVEKSKLAPGATFVVGVDTAARIGQARYYDNDEAACDGALRQLAERGCRFLVFGREVNDSFQTLRDLQLPEEFRALCEEVPEAEFRMDVSSTEMRGQVES